jgi:hypothetical protein
VAGTHPSAAQVERELLFKGGFMKDTITLNVLNPVSDVHVVNTSTSTRLSSLEGKRIGILENNKPGALMLLPFLQQGIKKQVPHVEMRVWKIPRHWSEAEKEPLLREIAGYGDAFIGLMGE